LQYIHFSPVKANLVNAPEEYNPSRVLFYLTNRQSIFPIIHHLEVFERRKVYEISVGLKQSNMRLTNHMNTELKI